MSEEIKGYGIENESRRRTLNLTIEDTARDGARIKVIGIGGAGGNAVNRMISEDLKGVEFIVANTDIQDLKKSKAQIKIQMGEKITKGLGAGADPEMGRKAAIEDTDKIIESLEGADMVFLTAGLGGGTGTGAAPVIANLARELDTLVVAVVTKPFLFEGKRRAAKAEQGLAELKNCIDSVITIPNQRLMNTVDRNTTLPEAFRMADDILRQAVQGISDLILIPGEVNLDFADVKTIMSCMGTALMGTGIAEGEHRAIEAAQKAISSPLLVENSIEGAKGLLINITGGDDMTLYEVSEASTLIQESADPDANIIWGPVFNPAMNGKIKITVIATGFDGENTVRRARAHIISPTPVLEVDQRDVPTDETDKGYYRSGASLGASFVPPEPPKNGDAFDIPTFMRQKLDK